MLLFLILTGIIKNGYTQALFAFDSNIQQFAYGLQKTPVLVTFFSNFTRIFGDFGGMITAGIVALVLFFIIRARKGAVWFAILMVSSMAVNTGVKHLVERARPESGRLLAFAHQSGSSFASGHSLFATILFGTLFLMFYQKMKTRNIKILWFCISVFMILLVMFSRIFVGVHYPSDTLGGLLEGLTFLCLTYPTFDKFQNKK